MPTVRAMVASLVVVLLAGCALPALPVPSAMPQVEPVEPPTSAAPEAPVATEPASIAGRWDGNISILGTQMRILVNFSRDGAAWSGTVDVPQQAAAGIPLHDITFEPPAVHFEMLPAPRTGVFEGELAGGTITGRFTQSGYEGTFELRAVAEEAGTPAGDVPYLAEEVTLRNNGITLAGTLTLPPGPGPHPAVILVSGSGQQNRDEEIPVAPGYRPFADIADHLTRQGIAVLRYDDRGVGDSTGDPAAATTADFAADAEAALGYLLNRPEIDAGQIGILGHSEGGQIATMLAARNDDVDFIILMAGPGERGDKILMDQIRILMETGGATAAEIEETLALQQKSYEVARTDQGWDELEAMVRAEIEASLAQLTEEQARQLGDVDQFVAQVVAQRMASMRSPWFRFFIDYDPAQDLGQIQVPVLALYGGLDTQVPAESNRDALVAALEQAGNQDVTVVVFPKANHLFQEAEMGSLEEYSLLAPELLPGFLETISDWLMQRMDVRSPISS